MKPIDGHIYNQRWKSIQILYLRKSTRVAYRNTLLQVNLNATQIKVEELGTKYT